MVSSSRASFFVGSWVLLAGVAFGWARQDEGALEEAEAPAEVTETPIESVGPDGPPVARPDPRGALERVVSVMGGDALDRAGSIAFRRESLNWRAGKLAYWEGFDTRARLGAEGRHLIRADESAIDPTRAGAPQSWSFVVNEYDRFMLKGRIVKAAEFQEIEADRVARYELFTLLAPWIVLRGGSDFRDEGRFRVETWHPTQYVAPAPGQDAGYVDYQPVAYDCDVFSALPPEAYQDAIPGRVTFATDPRDGRLLWFRCRQPGRGREGIYGDAELTFEITGWERVGDVALPAEMHLRRAADPQRLESIRIREIEIGPDLDDSLFRRP